MGQRQKFNISEYGPVAYRIKWNDTCINMVATISATILPIDRLPGPCDGSKGQKAKIQLFQNMIMLNIKFKGMTNAATCKQILCPYTLLRGFGSNRSKHFSEIRWFQRYFFEVWALLWHKVPLG